MQLAKPHLDIGLFTEAVEAHHDFWTHTAGLTLDHELQLEPGWVDLVGPGFRYITVQVFDADAEMAGIVERGGRIARDSVSFAGVARFGFVADPDGNWIEVSARTSLTGIEVG